MSSQPTTRRPCQKCVQGELRRLNRTGFVEREILYAFGFFPWECVLCRRKFYRRDNGHPEAGQRTPQKVSPQPGQKPQVSRS
jgi:hypothetical protein